MKTNGTEERNRAAFSENNLENEDKNDINHDKDDCIKNLEDAEVNDVEQIDD